MLAKIKAWIKYFNSDSIYTRRHTRRQKEIEAYLSQSVDLCDLERRIRELDRKTNFRSLY